MKLIRIGCNHNSACAKLENLDDIFNQGQKMASFVTSVSARKLKCASCALLGMEPFQLGSAQLGKFQVKLIIKLIIIFVQGFKNGKRNGH